MHLPAISFGTTDTRKLQKDDLYFALKGPSFNGNTFARQAIEKVLPMP
jgi:UDP-N-acetylmuramoyl-tripeptide--D-alanyl-D-alanine ligase